jgi:hypothetical protein
MPFSIRPLHLGLSVRLTQTVFVAVLSTALGLPAAVPAQSRVPAPDSLTDAEFWTFFRTMSEPDGYFLSENFVSNEASFQEVIPRLQRSLTKDGVYLGVGPEQNFTYIANLGPRMAVIFDIRRQNAMQHLMYKALFEMSATRAEFVARLFSRPSVSRLAPGIAVAAMFDSAQLATPDDSAYKANLAGIIDWLTDKHGFALPKEDIATIEHVYGVFFEAGPDVNYGYRSGMPGPVRSTYPTYGMLQSATNANSVPMAFLASEANYQAVRTLQLRNLIVPVVGDFGGPSAIRAVGAWLRNREMTVTAFYLSNVEQYLFRENGASDRFYANVSSLPVDSTSHFIRSVPRTSGMNSIMSFGPAVRAFQAGTIKLTYQRDSSGNMVTQMIRDSAGVTLVQTAVDSSRRDTLTAMMQKAIDSLRPGRVSEIRIVTPPVASTPDSAIPRDSLAAVLKARRDSIARASTTWQVLSGPAMSVVMGGLLTSGTAPIQGTLKAFFLGELKGYNAIIEMTKVNER